MCRCVKAKQKLDHSVIDGEGLEYHISVMVVTSTWLRRYSMKNPNLWLFEDWKKKEEDSSLFKPCCCIKCPIDKIWWETTQ